MNVFIIQVIYLIQLLFCIKKDISQLAVHQRSANSNDDFHDEDDDDDDEKLTSNKINELSYMFKFIQVDKMYIVVQ